MELTAIYLLLAFKLEIANNASEYFGLSLPNEADGAIARDNVEVVPSSKVLGDGVDRKA